MNDATLQPASNGVIYVASLENRIDIGCHRRHHEDRHLMRFAGHQYFARSSEAALPVLLQFNSSLALGFGLTEQPRGERAPIISPVTRNLLKAYLDTAYTHSLEGNTVRKLRKGAKDRAG